MRFLQFYGIDWLATVSGLTGVYLLGNRNKVGFVLFMLASLSWATFGILTGSAAMAMGSFVFFCLHLRGFINWSREAKTKTVSA